MPFDRVPMLDRLSRRVNDLSLDAVVISKRANVRYFSGFSGSSGDLAVTTDSRWLLTDFRYVDQAAQTAPDFIVRSCKARPVEEAVVLLQKQGCRRIGFEGDALTFDAVERLRSLPDSDVQLISVRLDGLRTEKTVEEIKRIAQAASIADQALANLAPEVRIGCSENELAAMLEYQMRILGSERVAFETIVASGPRSALPHGVASDRRIKEGDLIVFDFGAVVDGYHSDMTRTWFAGEPDAESLRLYNAVMQAQLESLAMVRPGVRAFDVDAKARKILAEAELLDYFGHGLGHSVGLEIHEEPRFSPLSGDVILERGMVMTVEPGVYIPGKGGVRVEDLVVVTVDGCEILSRTPKNLRLVGR